MNLLGPCGLNAQVNDRGVEMADPARELGAFIGEWSLEMMMPGQEPSGDVGARVTFEWMPGGETWLIERWTVPIPEAPDGMAIIG